MHSAWRLKQPEAMSLNKENTMKTFITAIMLVFMSTFITASNPVPKGAAGPAPTAAEVTESVNRWVRNVKLDRPDKLVVEGVRVVGTSAWKRDWNDYHLTGIGKDAFPQKETYDYGWEVRFFVTTTSRDGVVTRHQEQAVLIIPDNPPRVRRIVK